MKQWEIKVFDEGGTLLKKKIIESNSKFEIKRQAKLIASKIEDSDSYTAQVINDKK